MDNTGYVLYNSSLKGFLNSDGYFTSDLIEAKILSDEAKCRTEIKRIARAYKNVPDYSEENLQPQKVSVQLIDQV
jgi:hypothetical protein